MTAAEGLSVALTFQRDQIVALGREAAATAEATMATGREIGSLDARLDAAMRRAGLEPEVGGGGADSIASTHRTGSDPASRLSWEDLRTAAAERLASQGIDPATVRLDDLLDPEEVARIERRHSAGFRVKADLDCYDIAIAVSAGLVATILDVLLVGIPVDTKWWGGGGKVKASPLTDRLRELSLDNDNALSRWAKVSYDRVSGLPEKLEGFGGTTHRVMTLGHDPLLGLLYGVKDIMRGEMTAIPGRSGGVMTQKIHGGVDNPFIAMALQLMHLLSDLPTKTGLPLPGWVGLVSLDGPRFGPAVKGLIGAPTEAETIGGIARRMYMNGYDSWHLMTMMTSVGALEVVLRSYWGLRRTLDEEWAAAVEDEADLHGAEAVSDHPRFAAMSLAAHGVAAAGNLTKLALAGGNPLAFNYAQWLAFLKAFYRWVDDQAERPNEVLDRQARANAMAIESGWTQVDFTDPSFGQLVAATMT